MSRVLLAGESWISAATDHKGYDAFSHTQIELGCAKLLEVLEKSSHQVTHMRSHDVAEHFPSTMESLELYDVVILSDIGSNSLFLHPETFVNGRPYPNRIKLLRDWVHAGGGLMMAGGYLSFQGFEGKANYQGTAVEDVLPVIISPFDDRVETPEGAQGKLTERSHFVTESLPDIWPILLGYQKVEPKEDADVLARIEGEVLLAARTVAQGRTIAFTSDISPHWAPEEFLNWTGYGTLFSRCIDWLANND